MMTEKDLNKKILELQTEQTEFNKKADNFVTLVTGMFAMFTRRGATFDPSSEDYSTELYCDYCSRNVLIFPNNIKVGAEYRAEKERRETKIALFKILEFGKEDEFIELLVNEVIPKFIKYDDSYKSLTFKLDE